MKNPFEAIELRFNKIEILLKDLVEHSTKEQTNSASKDEFLTVKETAAFLKLSVPTIYGLINKGQLPVMKRSKRCYFFKNDLVNYLKEGRRKTTSEIEQEAEKHISTKKIKI